MPAVPFCLFAFERGSDWAVMGSNRGGPAGARVTDQRVTGNSRIYSERRPLLPFLGAARGGTGGIAGHAGLGSGRAARGCSSGFN